MSDRLKEIQKNLNAYLPCDSMDRELLRVAKELLKMVEELQEQVDAVREVIRLMPKSGSGYDYWYSALSKAAIKREQKP